MARREEAVFPARLDALPRTAAFAHAFCEVNQVSRDDALRLRLVLEELFTNSVEHGYGGDGDARIHIVLEARGDAVTVLYEDSAPRYDPMQECSDSAASAEDLESRPLGGLGVQLVRELTSATRYAYEDGVNRLWLTLQLRDAP